MRYLALLALLAIPACAVHVHKRDAATITSIEVTAKNRARDAERAAGALERAAAEAATGTARPEALRQEARNIRALDAAEQVRLASWRWREEQKSDE